MKDNSNKVNRNHIIVFFSLLIISLSIPIIIYTCNFKDHVKSGLSADWGTFGDFMGGVLNPIIGLANIVILVYLTIKISNIEESRKSQELAFQKELREQELVSQKELRDQELTFQKQSKLNDLRLQYFKELSNHYLETRRLLKVSESYKVAHQMTNEFINIVDISSIFFKSLSEADTDKIIRVQNQIFKGLSNTNPGSKGEETIEKYTELIKEILKELHLEMRLTQ